MKKSRSVPIVTLSAIALAFSACGDDEETAYCVDENDVIVDNEECDDDYNRGIHGGYFWYFGGNFGNRTPTKGTKVPPGGEKIQASNRAALQSKGGFGSQARGSGVGRSVSGGG